ncbi:MAG TPA: aldo/keto reductase [Acidimicrobiia bacterium]|nr:aldo/keto reductase [Acidimicrobiia bacterium]
MEYVTLGTTGLSVSPVCLGMMSYGDPSWRDWILGEDHAEPFVRRAADLGINFFDTADMYSLGVSEEVAGRLLKSTFTRREDYVVATKVYFPVGDGPNDGGLSRGHILDSIDNSLRRLDLDHVDLYQIHRWDPNTPIEETMEALNDCVRSGRVRYIGASSMSAWQFAKAQHVAEKHGWTRFVTMQNHYNLLYREEEREMAPQCRDMGVGMLPWSPLARGLLTRPRSEGDATIRGGTDHLTGGWYADSNHEIIDVVEEVARDRGVPMARVALSWVISRPGVTAPVVGATKLDHLDDAVAAIDLKLDETEAVRLEELYRPRPVAH